MATPNLNLQEITLDDKLRTDFINKINNNMAIIDTKYSELKVIPRSCNFSIKVGLIPVEICLPITFEFSIPDCSNLNISCIVITLPSMPEISETETTFLEPSCNRLT